MRIACPSCAANYDVPDARLKPGKSVRCARCGSDWLPGTEVDQVSAEAASPEETSQEGSSPDEPSGHHDESAASLPSEITAVGRLSPSRTPPRRQPALIGAWVATGILLAGAVAATVGWRDTVVRVWPPSGRILATTVHTEPHVAQTEGKKVE